MIDFEMLDPNLVLQFIQTKSEEVRGEGEDKVEEKVLDKNLENSGVESGSLLQMMGGYVFILSGAFLVLIIMVVIMIVAKKHRAKI